MPTLHASGVLSLKMAQSQSQSQFQAVQDAVANLSVGQAILLAGIAWAAFKTLQALYYISPLHPLSNVPGPKLAAATYWPEFYHDVVLGGRYTHAIKRMHDQYGKSIQIEEERGPCNPEQSLR